MPGYSPIIVIGCMYNLSKVLSFISKEYAERKKAGIHYLFKYPDPFSNVVICLVYTPLVIYICYLYLLISLTRQKSSQSGLALEK